MKSIDRRELAYWLALAFHLPRARVRDKNALVLRAAHDAGLSLLELIALETEELPAPLRSLAPLHARLLEAEGRVSAQAFVVDRLAQGELELVPVTHSAYPRHLLERLTPGKAPTLLSVAGDVALLREPGVAVSGSRKAGPAGLCFARAVGRALAEAGFTVVSGLARGVDSEALEGALEAGGRVIGVAPEGIFKTRAIRRREVQDGRLTILSEFEPTARWAGWAAMRRNSTIAGMSRALFIADCVAEGGTTAQFDVHRDHGLPVYIRRGPGEGRLMAELAARPGAEPLPWARGLVVLPSSLGGATGPQRALRCSVWREGGRLHVTVDAPDSSAPGEILDAVRTELRDQSVVREATMPYTVEARAAEANDAPSVRELPAASEPEEEDPLLRALATMDGGRATVAALCERVGWPATKTRAKLRSLEESGKITADRSGRAHVFALLNQDESPQVARRSQLELLSG
ncbi:hypothetical protein ENSA5_45500 [Enhygromyxa salina]|uniref:Smf/DprA SLOG domain-containing protein n=1 Tax=Enhygromyxa salina TaxID=215803 RepID=A0A2S9XJK8_9BACT|nr:DNA-processing protein DprA [Enhygromyxa salina]PRP93058.1 hypothetical protein ENSA5_45500 [Enhygromyxa salina]